MSTNYAFGQPVRMVTAGAVWLLGAWLVRWAYRSGGAA